ncbi:MAG: hypothetical protein M1816_004442 [Peltula sp. TS41687]|nr:MAG: hypothetical protein M1816_004442 [Peltula sp. TS41687]
MSHVDSNGALKTEPTRDGSISSIGSTSEPELEPSPLEHTTTPKRKGGRKPIYATSEERKQRNRQAQAAFRERRTEYIKQLETTIKHHEDALQSLQQSHRTAADECLMLRYKNSLLERILLEKGIDIQAELNAKSGSPHAGPTSPLPSAASASKPSPIQRAILNNRAHHHQAQRSNGGRITIHSPPAQPTPPSQLPSPISTSSGVAPHGVLTPPGPHFAAHQRQGPPGGYLGPVHPRQPVSSVDPQAAAMMAVTSAEGGHSGVMSSGYYPGPFQSHIDQLGKHTQSEYDAQADIVDDPYPSEQTAGLGTHRHLFPSKPILPGLVPPSGPRSDQHRAPGTAHPSGGPPFTSPGESGGPVHVRHDEDPFGLWQSMTFPAPLSFPPSSIR